MKSVTTVTKRERKHKIIRKKVSGTTERPRMSIYRSLGQLYVQIVNDDEGTTLLALSTLSPEIADKIGKNGGNVKGAVALGDAVAAACKEKKIAKIVFDRSGYIYHGRIKALAEAARKGGLDF